jgi:curved DNA-binding protein CbpA
MARSPDDDYYALLGVLSDVTDDELKRVWRKLALAHHPDRAGPAATPMFQRISVAYSVLSDPDARAAYDRFCGVEPRRKTAAPAPSNASASSPSSAEAAEPLPRRAPGVMLDRLCGSLQQLLMRGVADYAPDHDDLIDLFLDAEESAQGGMIRISMRVEVKTSTGLGEEVWSAWLAVKPDMKDGTILTPSAWLPGMVHPVYFRLRRR